MDSNKVDMFIATMSEKFPSEKMMLIRDRLEKMDDSKLIILHSVEYKNPTTILIVAVLLGGFGVDRFMLDQAGLGVLKIITCGGLGIWAIIDWFTATSRARNYNFQKFAQVA